MIWILGAAEEELQQAEKLAQSACSSNGGLRAAWKLLGDIQLLLATTGPASKAVENTSSWAEGAFKRSALPIKPAFLPHASR